MDHDIESIPSMGIDQAEGIVRTINSRFDGQVSRANEEDLANALNHTTADSGAFRSKLADLRKYGFIEGHGDKQLTPLAQDLVDNKPAAIRRIINNTELFKRAKDHFGTSTIDKAEWHQWLADRGVEDLTDSEVTDLQTTYNTLIRQLPQDDGDPFSEEYFDKYFDNLDDPQKRELCIQSLRDLASKPLPSLDYYDKIYEVIREEEYPNQTAQFVNILKHMCFSSTELIRDERMAKTVELAIERLDQSSQDSVRWYAIRMLESLNPGREDLNDVSEMWNQTLSLAKNGHENDDEEKLKHARRLFHLLISDWADEALLEQIEKDTFDAYIADDDFADFVQYWHKSSREELGLV